MLIMNIRLYFVLVDVCRPLVRGLEAVEEAETNFSKKNSGKVRIASGKVLQL